MAKFTKGEKRPPNAGRKKGTLNKATTSFRQQVAERGFSVVDAAITLLSETEDDAIKAKMIEFIAKYSHVIPTREEADEPEDSPEEELSTEELEELARLSGRSNG
jgi:hypothetical protein